MGSSPSGWLVFGSLLYNQQHTDVKEDFDDALLQMYFPENLIGQVTVSRNHVAGYRNETWVYGTEGLVHVGAFSADSLMVEVEAFGRRGLIERREFALRDYGAGGAVFYRALRAGVQGRGSPLYRPVPRWSDRLPLITATG